MASRAYTQEDYGACRYCRDNNVGPGYSGVVLGLGIGITEPMVKRLRLLNLCTGPADAPVPDGTVVRLSGLGVKTADEAVRLNIPAVFGT